jgi:leader peptidase (prepilin peptidase)/N-methyltransferase
MLRPLTIAWGALVGSVVGSFLNVVVARLPKGESVVHPRSRCPGCGAGIAWYDNLPVLSWLLLRARCRRCHAPISARYPLVELLVALLGALAIQRHGLAPAAAAELAFGAFLVALAFIDLDTWLLPFALSLPLAALGLAAGWLQLAPSGSLLGALLGGGAGFLAFLVVHLVGEKVFKREAMGFGDVVLLGGIGCWLGAGALLPVILLSSLQGSLVGIALLLIGRGQPGPPTAPDSPGNQPPRLDTAPAPAGQAPPGSVDPAPVEEDDWIPPRNAVPFGPFLALAALEWLLLGPWLAGAVPLLAPFLGK